MDEENRATEATPLVLFLPSPGSTGRPSISNPLQPIPSDSSLYFAARSDASGRDQERSTGSLELLIPANLVHHDQLHQSKPKQAWSTLGKFSAGLLIIAILTAAGFSLKPSSPPNVPRDIPGIQPQSSVGPLPFSRFDPVNDFNVFNLVRPHETSPPDHIRRKPGEAVPTCQWYQNLVLLRGEPSSVQRVYTVPFIVDTVGVIPGVRMHPNRVVGTNTVIQLAYDEPHGLTLGSTYNMNNPGSEVLSKKYSVEKTTPLAITLGWDKLSMTSSIVRGMPYTTMLYSATDDDEFMATIGSSIALREDPVADGVSQVTCKTGEPGDKFRVEGELQMTFEQSDFTWIAFFSRPVMVQCASDLPAFGEAKVAIQFEPVEEQDSPLIARIALVTDCTLGRNPRFCQDWDKGGRTADFLELLREHAGIYPGPDATIKYDIDDQQDQAVLSLDWDAQIMPGVDESKHIISYALPHQHDRLDNVTDFCSFVMLGKACITTGSVWTLDEPLPSVSFLAPRPPRADAIPMLATALEDDLSFRLPEYFMRGAGDTYFSGKMLAKAARILVIADEVQELCTQSNSRVPSSDKQAYAEACSASSVPADDETHALLELLRGSVEIWINGSAEAPFLYDEGWGGFINCGCLFNEKTQSCNNQFPDCPSISDPGLNFGNGFYNDHHFHYGYHIYAAAVVASYDPQWGRENFEGVKLLIRDFANPSLEDKNFPLFRQKDWYEGHSWASGISNPVLNGRNQESSSEAIAAYEAVALFGKVMVDAWEECKHCQDQEEQLRVSQDIRDVGRLLVATEIRSTDRYWHLKFKSEPLSVYPETYRYQAIGILWNTMAQFQTWFGGAPYLAYGIQLLPITPIAEQRDDPHWLKELYGPFADSCNADKGCETDGWSVLQQSVLASVGHVDLALKRVNDLPSSVFETAGGNGHSRSNSLWFIATRPHTEPIELPISDAEHHSVPTGSDENDVHVLTDCGCPKSCTDNMLGHEADGHSCRDRISWLIQERGNSQHEACKTVARYEFPDECGGCDPSCGNIDDESKDDESTDEEVSQCPPCSLEQCASDLNRCPVYDRTFVCSGGPSTGGCANTPWELTPSQCHECCELSHCPKKLTPKKKVIDPSVCPPCEYSVCKSRLNLCPADAAPYLCIQGAATGGCSPSPWDIQIASVCTQCCTVVEGCDYAQPFP